MASMFMCESQTRKTLTLLLQHALPSTSSSSNNSSNTNLPWLRLQQPPLLPDFPPSSAPASALPPPRSFLSSLLHREDVWSGRALYSNTWTDGSFPMKSLGLTLQEGATGGRSAPRGSPIQYTWTYTLIASNLLAYGAQIATGGRLMNWGAQINSLIAQGQLYRLITSSFLHGSIMHLLLNCYGIYSIGFPVETTSGSGRFLAVYFISAVASSMMSYRFTKGYSIGASGAVAGLVGAYAVYLMRNKDLLGDHSSKGLTRIATIIGLNMWIGYSFKNIDNWGHLGGFLGGVAASWFLGPAFKVGTNPKDGRRVMYDGAPIFKILGLGRRDR